MVNGEVKNMIPFKSLIFIMLMMLPGIKVAAQNVEAYSKLDSSAIMIGDQINLEIGISIPENFKVIWPLLVDTVTRNIEIIEKEDIDTSKLDGNLQFKQLLTITSFDSGYFEIPSVEFEFFHENDTTKYTAGTNTLFLMVNTPVVDTSKAFKVIKGPVREPYTFAEIFPWALLGLVIIGLVIFLIWYIRKRKNNQPVFARRPKPQLPPHILAIQKLEELRLAKIWQQGKVKEYYTALTDIVREYFDGRFDVDAMEMTSDEILEALNEKPVNNQAIDKIRNVLELADLVKFAKAQTTPLENDLCLSHCIDVVNETKPVIQPEAKKESEKPVVKEEV